MWSGGHAESAATEPGGFGKQVAHAVERARAVTRTCYCGVACAYHVDRRAERTAPHRTAQLSSS